MLWSPVIAADSPPPIYDPPVGKDGFGVYLPPSFLPRAATAAAAAGKEEEEDGVVKGPGKGESDYGWKPTVVLKKYFQQNLSELKRILSAPLIFEHFKK